MYREIGMKSQDFHRKSHRRLPIFTVSRQNFPMRTLTATLCLTLAVVILLVSESASADDMEPILEDAEVLGDGFAELWSH